MKKSSSAKNRVKKPSSTWQKNSAAPAVKQVSAPAGDFEEDGNADSPGFFIVGIGASAGGYEAFVQFLGALPKDTAMAFVLVQHLDPNHDSQLTELLTRSATLPVHEVTNGLAIQPNHIYVMPQNVNMFIEGGKLRLSPRKPDGAHMPVDTFLRSLAQEEESRAIGIVLSGTGTDGTLGLQAIKGQGGITFAQDEKSSKYFGMPRSAINAGFVDMVLAPEAMARELGRIAKHPFGGQSWKRKQARARASAETVETERMFEDRERDLHALFAQLRVRTNVDFSLYKPSTLKRRILRRMLLHKINSFPEYVEYLRAHPLALDELFDDLLINVTGFFRDPTVFQALRRRIFPKIMSNRPVDSPVRIWVCGCSTGEEVYSLAISLVEYFEAARQHANVQIFATDIGEGSLEKARAGHYPENIVLDVSTERLRRFFVKSNGGYQVSKAIRDMCVFARQNVINDPPFSNLDLISCRNVLIYLGQQLQRKIMPVFHYALKPEGFLLLGSSEAISAAADLFALRDKKCKIYSKKAAAYRSGVPRVYQKEGDRAAESHRAELPVELKPELKTPDLQLFVDRLILNKWCPAAVVINSQMDVLLFRGRTGTFLEHAPGSASLNLLKMARENLTLDLRSAISKAVKHNAATRQDNVPLRQNGHVRPVSIEVMPFQLTPGAERFYLVLFLEGQGAGEMATDSAGRHQARKARHDTESREVSRLRTELASNKESLQSIIEEQEATNEELKSANEEIQSSNEELQSTNEELETAKEELQSTNEELTTLNEELQTRNMELSQLNNDLTNLLSSAHAAIILLGNDLTVRRFTSMAERIFNLIPSDVGRRLSDLNRNIVVPDLDESLRNVVDNLTTVEQEVQDREGHWYSLRIRPYRTRENQIGGAVLLLVDIEEHKRALELLMESVKTPLMALQSDLKVKNANTAFYQAFQVTREETEGRFIQDLGERQWNIVKLRNLLDDITTKEREVDDFEVEGDFPKLGHRKMLLNARCYAEDRSGRKLIMLSIRDVTE